EQAVCAAGKKTGARIGAARGGNQRRSDAMAAGVAETDRDPPVRQRLPIKVIAAGLFGRLIPTGQLEAAEDWLATGQQALLNRAGDVEGVMHTLQLSLQLGLAQGGE